MKNKILPTLCLMGAMTIQAIAAGLAPAPLSVAVYDFKGSGDAASLGNNVTTLVTAGLTTETNIVMVERSELKKALNEQAFGVSGMVSSDAAAKIGKITGAKVLVSGKIIKTSSDHVVIVADIIGTETGRLFANQVQGSTDDLVLLTSELSRKIAQTIVAQSANLATPPAETHDERVERIVKSITGPNRPAVSVVVKVLRPDAKGRSSACEGEFGELLLKAGFNVVDDNSDQKPDIEITGVSNYATGKKQGNFFYARGVLEMKVQERRTGKIIFYDHQESTGTDPVQRVASRLAEMNAVDGVAERLLPVLAK